MYCRHRVGTALLFLNLLDVKMVANQTLVGVALVPWVAAPLVRSELRWNSFFTKKG